MITDGTIVWNCVDVRIDQAKTVNETVGSHVSIQNHRDGVSIDDKQHTCTYHHKDREDKHESPDVHKEVITAPLLPRKQTNQSDSIVEMEGTSIGEPRVSEALHRLNNDPIKANERRNEHTIGVHSSL